MGHFTFSVILQAFVIIYFSSVVLQNLLSLGVDLSRVEMDHNASAFFMKCDWEKHIQPYMVWLHQVSVPLTLTIRVWKWQRGCNVGTGKQFVQNL